MKKITFLLFLAFLSLHVASQNVGIGVLIPTEKLEVDGNLKLTNNTKGVLLSNADAPMITRGWDPFTSGPFTDIGRWGLFMQPNRITIGMPDVFGKAFSVSTFKDNSTIAADLFTVMQWGSVGIGQSLPNARFEVAKDSNLFVIRDNGNVGINVLVPNAKLEIKGSTNRPLVIRNGADQEVLTMNTDVIYNAVDIGGSSFGSYAPLSITNRFFNNFGNPILKLAAIPDYPAGGSEAKMQFMNNNNANSYYEFRTQNSTTESIHAFRLDYINFVSGNKTLFHFNQAGQMGIGGSPSVGKVDVVHNSTATSPQIFLKENETDYARIGFGSTASSNTWSIAGLNSSPSTNDRLHFNNSVTGDLMTITGPGNVGIGYTSPAYKLAVNGSINSSTLSGTGTRDVKADANGTLTTAVTTSYLSIPLYSFTKRVPGSADVLSFSIAGGNVGVNFPAGSTQSVMAPVFLPHGATIVNMKVFYLDNSVQNLDVAFMSTSQTSPGVTSYSTFTTSGASATVQSSTQVFSLTVNNSLLTYFIELRPDTGSTWDGSLLFVKAVIIEYTL